MKFSQIKAVIEVCNAQFSEPNFKEVIENLIESNDDFEVDNVRFIKASEIARILGEELASDEYILGCFNADFICTQTNLNYEMVEACQNLQAFEAIGKGILSDCNNDLTEFAEDYASVDGYGHHFNGYDFSEEEHTFLIEDYEETYYIFDNH